MIALLGLHLSEVECGPPGRSLPAGRPGAPRRPLAFPAEPSGGRSTLRCRYVRVLLTCWSCKHQRDADLAGLIAAGRGDTPLVQLRWRCAACGSRRIDMVCTSHARVVPWRSEQAPALP